MSLPSDAHTALETFNGSLSWEQRARLLMQWGDRLTALSDEAKTDEHLVDGCESKVWLVGDVVDGHWQFRAASDARLIRGLVALLLARVNGLSAQALQQVDLVECCRRCVSWRAETA
jgi:cysteine desulfuration protein SufE